MTQICRQLAIDELLDHWPGDGHNTGFVCQHVKDDLANLGDLSWCKAWVGRLIWELQDIIGKHRTPLPFVRDGYGMADGDSLLHAIRDGVNAGHAPVPITFQMGAFLVTGTLVGTLEFWRTLQDRLAYEGTAGMTVFSHLTGAFLDDVSESAASLPDEPDHPSQDSVVYLLNASILLHSGKTQGVGFWRGTTTAIDAWWFGYTAFGDLAPKNFEE